MKVLRNGILFFSSVLLLSGTIVTTNAQAFGSMGLRSSTSNISRNIRNQVRKALKPTLTINKKAKLSINGLTANNSGRYLATLHESSILVWDVKEGIMLSRIDLQDKNPRSVAFSDNGVYLLVTGSSGRAMQFPLLEEDGQFQNLGISEAAAAIYSSHLKQWLIGTRNGKLIAVDPQTRRQSFSVAISKKEICCITALPGSEVAVATRSGEIQTIDLNRQGAFLDHWKTASDIKNLYWSGADNKLVAVTSGKSHVFTPGDSQPQVFPASTGDMVAAGVTNGALYFFDDRQLVSQSLQNGRLQKTAIEEEVSDMTAGLAVADNLLLLTGKDGLLYGFKAGDSNLYLKWVVTKEGWTIVDQKGRFDGSAGGVKEIAWTAEGRSVGLDGFSSSYYEPGLLKKLISLESQAQYFVKPEKGIGDGIFFPPEVSLDVDKSSGMVDISIVAEGQTDEGMKDISRLYLYHNWKRVDEKYQTGHDVDNEKNLVTWRYRVPLVNGDNSFYASVSGWSSIKSKSDVVSFNTSIKAEDASSFIVNSIGINQYSDDGLVLNYSVADAKAVADKFTDEVGVSKTRRIKSIILNDQAKSGGIRKNLEKLADLRTTDTAVVFLSGHGVAIDNSWYFLPQETTSLEDKAHIKRVGISGADIARAIVSSPAQKILLAVDACQSGAVLNDFQTFTQRKTLQQLSEDTGVHILTATRADQLAPEYEILGHGLFTYTLLKGLSKIDGVYNADRWPRDNNLTVGELKKYVLRYAPLLARKLNEQSLTASAERGGEGLDVLVTPAQLSSGADFKLN